MDAYNRGYDQGIDGLSDATATRIGTATIRATSDSDPASAEVAGSFYAVAYNDPTYGTIISYRGTDAPLAELVQVDWSISYAGNYEQEQIVLAAEFAKAVEDSGASQLLLTGHSLGGALAGLALH